MNEQSLGEVVSRIREHADGTPNANDPTNLADHVWMLEQGTIEVANLKSVWVQIAGDFDRLNHKLRQLELDSRTEIPLRLVYAVNGMVVLCLNHDLRKETDSNIRASLRELAWRITAAWDAVLAGDIDDIAAHVDLEFNARAAQ